MFLLFSELGLLYHPVFSLSRAHFCITTVVCYCKSGLYQKLDDIVYCLYVVSLFLRLIAGNNHFFVRIMWLRQPILLVILYAILNFPQRITGKTTIFYTLSSFLQIKKLAKK